ncbi:DNA/RNA helicase domain-containing protein [Tessaracoccus sp. Z1128]
MPESDPLGSESPFSRAETAAASSEPRVALGSDTRIEILSFAPDGVGGWKDMQGRHRNWPVVYTLNNNKNVYVGESLNAVGRLNQHLESEAKRGLEVARVVIDDTFNKSACLDLESFLIRMFSGDGRYEVLNRNDGVTNAEYYQRDRYQSKFSEIFTRLRQHGLFNKSIPEIQNSDLFKLSPFKALNQDQAAVIEDLVEGLFYDMAKQKGSVSVVEGGPGTGKTIVAIYLIKLLVDIRDGNDQDNPDAESVFSDFFTPGHPEMLAGARIGLVVPQQSLRQSIRRVFDKTPGLSGDMVLTPYDVASDARDYDILVVDETHRLTQYGAQAMGTLTKRFGENSMRLALGHEDWKQLTQIDWVMRRSRHKIFLLDQGQGVRPIDVTAASLDRLRGIARAEQRGYRLLSQMRVQAGDDYVQYVREVMSGRDPAPLRGFGDYDLRFYDSFVAMRNDIIARDRERGLARLVAGYAWPWVSRTKQRLGGDEIFDIEIDAVRLCWNRTPTDWISSRTSIEEVGSIHTVQGYDLNYAGVIIGKDLRYDLQDRSIVFDRANYFDSKGKALNNNLLGRKFTDADIAEMVRNIYVVLLTRGILGTYIYVCDDALRGYLRTYFASS